MSPLPYKQEDTHALDQESQCREEELSQVVPIVETPCVTDAQEQMTSPKQQQHNAARAVGLRLLWCNSTLVLKMKSPCT